jgi:hypothetical protein
VVGGAEDDVSREAVERRRLYTTTAARLSEQERSRQKNPLGFRTRRGFKIPPPY